MDGWLKGLVAATCAVVIAGIGYFIWVDHQRSVEEKRRQDARNTQSMCNIMIDDLKSGNTDRDWRILHVTKCIEDGYLTESDFTKAGLGGILDQARPSLDYDKKQAEK